jgi:rod shape-determining protein MreD
MKLKAALFYLFFINIFLLLQSTLLNYIAISGIIPNLVVVFIIITALVRGNVEGGIVGFFAGLAQDMLFGGMLGFYALFGMYLGIAAGSTNKRLFRENLLVVVFLTFVYSVIYETLIYIVNTVMSGDIHLWRAMAGVILPEALYNCLAAVLINPILLRADKRFAEADKTVRKY